MPQIELGLRRCLLQLGVIRPSCKVDHRLRSTVGDTAQHVQMGFSCEQNHFGHVFASRRELQVASKARVLSSSQVLSVEADTIFLPLRDHDKEHTG